MKLFSNCLGIFLITLTFSSWAIGGQVKSSTVTCPSSVQVQAPKLRETLPEPFSVVLSSGTLSLSSANLYSGSVDQMAVQKPYSYRPTKQVDHYTYLLNPKLDPAFMPYNVVCEYGQGLVQLVHPLPISTTRCSVTDNKTSKESVFVCSP